jgi:hypothetical protein
MAWCLIRTGTSFTHTFLPFFLSFPLFILPVPVSLPPLSDSNALPLHPSFFLFFSSFLSFLAFFSPFLFFLSTFLLSSLLSLLYFFRFSLFYILCIYSFFLSHIFYLSVIISGSRDSSVDIETTLRARRPRTAWSIPGKTKRFLLISITSRLALGPIQAPIQWVQGAVSRE